MSLSYILAVISFFFLCLHNATMKSKMPLKILSERKYVGESGNRIFKAIIFFKKIFSMCQFIGVKPYHCSYEIIFNRHKLSYNKIVHLL